MMDERGNRAGGWAALASTKGDLHVGIDMASSAPLDPSTLPLLLQKIMQCRKELQAQPNRQSRRRKQKELLSLERRWAAWLRDHSSPMDDVGTLADVLNEVAEEAKTEAAEG